MSEIALGWLGWTEEQTLHADVNAIMLGFEGRRKMLTGLVGEVGRPTSSAPTRAIAPPTKVKPQILTPKDFDRMFGGTPTVKLASSRLKPTRTR